MEETPRAILGDLRYALMNLFPESEVRGLEVGECLEADRGEGNLTDGGSRDVAEAVMEPDVPRRGGGEEEKVWRRKVLESMGKLTRNHLDAVIAWRDVIKQWECNTSEPPGEGSVGQHACGTNPREASLRSIIQSVSDNIDIIIGKFNAITRRLDGEISSSSREQQDTTSHPPSHIRPPPENIELSQTPSPPDLTQSHPPIPDTAQGAEPGPDRNATTDVVELEPGQQEESGQHAESQCVSLEPEDRNKKHSGHLTWITVGLTGQLDTHLCYVRAPAGVHQSLYCEGSDTLSSFMVTGAEELVSKVIQLGVQDGPRVTFPIAVVIPFFTRYRGNCRDIIVKLVDTERRASYICPITTEGNYGGQRGSFAEVWVYSLGLFAVVSCLKTESYFIPKKGLSLKLSMDPRISLTYLPGSFTAPIMAQVMLQPLDAVLLSAVKSRSEDYRAVVSTSPVLYLTHPLSQPLRRPLSITLPCAPRPKHKTLASEHMGQCYGQSGPTASKWDSTSRIRMIPNCAKSTTGEAHTEFLVLLGYKDQQWNTLEKIPVRNGPKGLVLFELMESFDRVLVVRLFSALNPCQLVSLAEDLEEAVLFHSVAIVLLRQNVDIHNMMVALVLSKDLSWELSRLKNRGYDSHTDSSLEVAMCEGDRLFLRFNGNITSKGYCNGQDEWIAFHIQRMNHLTVRLIEVDTFGNRSSSHYKGTLQLYRLPRAELDGAGSGSGNKKPLGDPVCRLPLTLPKTVERVGNLSTDITHSAFPGRSQIEMTETVSMSRNMEPNSQIATIAIKEPTRINHRTL